MNLQYVKGGQNLIISASDYNAFIDAARANKFKNNFQPNNNKIQLPYYKCFIDEGTLKYGDAVVLDQSMTQDYLQTNISGSDIKLSNLENKSLKVRLCQPKDGFNNIGVIVKSSKGKGSIMITSSLAIVRFKSDKLNNVHTRCYCGQDGTMISDDVGSHKIIKVLSYDNDYDTDDRFALVHINCGLVNIVSAKITANNSISANDRKWTYDWQFVKRTSTGWTNTGTLDDVSWAPALNGFQDNNQDGTTLQSSGYDFNAQPLLSNTNLELKPIRGYPIVQMTLTIDAETGQRYADFNALNIVQGQCGTGG